MNLTDLAALVGQTLTLDVGGFAVTVTVRDVKSAYGRALALVSQPGRPDRWVRASRLATTTPKESK